jgi:hypothetical protein
MAEEMILESFEPESDEAEDWESDEAFAESDDSVEDIGERTRRRRRRRNRFRPGRGVRGMTVRDADGRPRNVAFPAKLATADETNRGLANQEVARRALEQRLDRLETRGAAQLKNSSSVSGIVTLLIGGGLTAFSIFKAGQGGSGSVFSRWAEQDTAKMATLSSVSQIAATGAKLLVNGRYHRSGVGMAADAFAAVQVAGFALASLQQPDPTAKLRSVKDKDGRDAAGSAVGAVEGDRVYQIDVDRMFVLRTDLTSNKLIAVPL